MGCHRYDVPAVQESTARLIIRFPRERMRVGPLAPKGIDPFSGLLVRPDSARRRTAGPCWQALARGARLRLADGPVRRTDSGGTLGAPVRATAPRSDRPKPQCHPRMLDQGETGQPIA